MKSFNKRKVSIISLLMCILIALCAGWFLMTTSKVNAFADTETDYSNLSFSLINGNEYRVKAANRQITQAIIPATYNGYPVTEIMDNAFLSCSALEEVIIPESVKKIGTNAFYNCKNLQSLRGMSSVETIATNAFALCTKIRNLIIPASVKTMGSSIIKNVENPVYVRILEEEMTKFPSSWSSGYLGEIKYGNELTYSPVEVSAYSGRATEIHYNIQSYQNLNCPDEDVIIKCSVQEEDGTFSKVDNFEINAFTGTIVKSLTIQYDEENVGTNYTVNISSCTFFELQANSVNIEVDITLNEDIYGGEETSSSVFATSTISSVTLPASINRITGSMFFLCGNLEEIRWFNSDIEINHLDNIEYIDEMAFYECTALKNLYISDAICYIGYAAFGWWGTADSQQTIHIDLYTPNENEWGIDWDGEGLSTDVIEYKEMSIELEKNGGINGSNYFTIRYKQNLPQNLIAPDERAGYTFNGYYILKDNKEFYYYNANMESDKTWCESEPIILYAKWMPKTYTVTFDFQGGNDGSEWVEATYEQPMFEKDVKAPTRKGYDFDGYYTQTSGAGTQYYNDKMGSANNWDIPENTTLYANWISKEYTVIFDKDGGKGGSYFVTAIYGEDLPHATAPTKEGYKFTGYYSESGMPYYDEEMNPKIKWDIDKNPAILYARWKGENYTVFFENYDGVEEKPSVIATYDIEMPDAPIPERLGYTFNGYYTQPNGEGAIYYYSSMRSAHDWDIPADTTLYAHWTLIIYNINYLGVEDKYNPNPTTYTIELVKRWSYSFKEPTNCGYLSACEWSPARIDVGTTGDITVYAHYRERHLWENNIGDDASDRKIYVVANEMQFLEINEMEYTGYCHFNLISDLNFSNYENPMINILEFYTIFEGNNHTISGVNISATEEDFNFEWWASDEQTFGLFRACSAEIRNLTVIGNITVNLSVDTYCCVGLLCGEIFYDTSVKNCKTYGSVVVNGTNTIVGGIVGYCYGSIISCVNYASVSAQCDVGGIVGLYADFDNASYFKNNTNFGDVYGNCHKEKLCMGGLIGIVLIGNSVSDSANYGNIFVVYENQEVYRLPCVGYFIGAADFDPMPIPDLNCENSGTINIGELPEEYTTYIGGEIGYVDDGEFSSFPPPN